MKIDVQFQEQSNVFDAQFQEQSNVLDASFHEKSQVLESDFDSVVTIVEMPEDVYYEGEYTVVPDVEAQELPTALKRMKDDLTITEIPTSCASNNTGGLTFYIASTL